MTKRAKILLCGGITGIIVIAILILLIFSYRPDLFVRRECDTLSLELRERTISIPLKHKYVSGGYSPTHRIFESKESVDDIFLLFSKSVNENDRIEKATSGKTTFLYLYTDDSFMQGISIEPYGDRERYLKICVIEFVPPTLYDHGDDFEALFQDKSKLADGETYELMDRNYPDSFDMMKDYFSHIYELEVLGDTSITINVDGKKIILKEVSQN